MVTAAYYLFQIVAIVSAVCALLVSIVRLLELSQVRRKARRVIARIPQIRRPTLRELLNSEDPVKVEQALAEVRQLLDDAVDPTDEFSDNEMKMLRRVMGRRDSARELIAQ